MPDLSRIEKHFYKHPKARKARSKEPGSISLWLFANCYCRDHRKSGWLSREEALEMGTEAEIQALLDSGLWVEEGDGYRFKDWLDWNPDLVKNGTRPSSSWIVYTILGDHPGETQMRLARQVETLVDEGVTLPAIEAGLRKWNQRKDAPVTWLPYFVSDAIREGETGIHAAIKEARATGNVSALAEYGYRWTAPDTPPRIGAAKAREFIRERKSQWLDEIEAGIRSETATAG